VDVHTGLGPPACTLHGGFLLEFYDAFGDVQAVARDDGRAPGLTCLLHRSSDDFIPRIADMGYGTRWSLSAPPPDNAPGRVRLRMADGTHFFSSHAATEIVVGGEHGPIGLFFRILGDDVWAWVTRDDPDWHVSLARQGLALLEAK
jgi:hypothetical protein